RHTRFSRDWSSDVCSSDLGIIQQDDVVICISKSGNTPEIKVLIPLIKAFHNTLIAITGNKDSALGRQADFVLNAHVENEACPNRSEERRVGKEWSSRRARD